MPNELVRCAECGFLAIRHRWNRTLLEAEPNYRTNGTVPKSPGPIDEHEKIPVCFAAAVEFAKLVSREDADGILSVIQKQRECSNFIHWRHGFSPKEHQTMLDNKWKLEREEADRQWRQQCDERDKQWRELQSREDREWREKQSRIENRRHNVNLLVYGLLAIVAGIIGAAIQANWIPNLLRQ